MSLFGSKKKEVTVRTNKPKETILAKPATKKSPKTAKNQKTVATIITNPTSANHSIVSTIIRPRITEKSGILSQGGVYTFEIAANANKNSISGAIRTLYKVTPIRIAIINSPSKKVFVKGRKGVVSGIRKAMITLKKGDKIDFV